MVYLFLPQVQSKLIAVTEERDQVAAALQEHTVQVEDLKGACTVRVQYIYIYIVLVYTTFHVHIA